MCVSLLSSQFHLINIREGITWNPVESAFNMIWRHFEVCREMLPEKTQDIVCGPNCSAPIIEFDLTAAPRTNSRKCTHDASVQCGKAEPNFGPEFDTQADRQQAMGRTKTAMMGPGCDPTVFFASLQQALDGALLQLDGVLRHLLLSDHSVEGVQPSPRARLRLATATGLLNQHEFVYYSEACVIQMTNTENCLLALNEFTEPIC
ncbi:hypothetical protein T265_15541, partial [Opisthorchis viverrini]